MILSEFLLVLILILIDFDFQLPFVIFLFDLFDFVQKDISTTSAIS